MRYTFYQPYTPPPKPKSIFTEIKEGVEFIIGMTLVLGTGAVTITVITLAGLGLSFLLGGN